ncbi:restriction endonuclease [Lactobacillus amylovorus subsp. animalium]|uniref:BsuBI/PstI family type II restriction endonuclease n=1 Tax=Lactobacillus amylovorus TaxID=1604 RepID=UPI0010AC16EF|nr:BsuBI/PstI family type II restriction endonuclease [Lactobacillus amylovorus]TJY01675.1 restriction endonuclease [Lactobacillus amylovorus]
MELESLIEKTKQILIDLGMDSERSNERSVLTLLALAHLDTNTEWAQATNDLYTIRQIMDWMRDHLGQDYAANSRETIRRFTLHQFEAGGIVEPNADKPDRPINSPKWNYRLTPAVLKVIRSVGTSRYIKYLKDFEAQVNTWKAQQEEKRDFNEVPVSLPNGDRVKLSAGGQNILIKKMVEEFCPRFAPGGEVLYIDDTNHAFRNDQKKLISSLGIKLPERGKAPDLIVWLEKEHWLFLMEACSTHGPIDVIRKKELIELFNERKDQLVFVSCFPDRKVMRKYLVDLAWETEAWCASDPDHMIHLDGKKFIGPYEI